MAKNSTGGHPEQVKSFHFHFVELIGNILINHFGMDETKVNPIKRAFNDAVIAELIQLPGLNQP